MNTYLDKDDFIHNERTTMPGDTVLAVLTGPTQRALLVGKFNLSFYGTLDFFKGHLNLCKSHGNQCTD